MPRLLIIRFSAMGDIAMTAPVIKQLACSYPDLEISMVSRPFAAAFFTKDILGECAQRIRFIGINPKAPEYSGVLGLERLYRKLSSEHYDYVADFHGVLRTHYLRLRFRLAGVRTAVIDKHRNERRSLVASGDKKVRHQLPTSFENYADVLRRLGFQLPPLGAPQRLANRDSMSIGIAPFAAHQGKVLPVETMERAIQMVIERTPDMQILLFGRGKQEDEVFGRWTEKYPQCRRVTDMAKNLSEELEIMRNLRCMVSMDSANMHLASLVGTRVVSIWGATHPWAGFMGWGQSVDDAIQADLDCRPCSIFGNKPCMRGDMVCMKQISAERIVEKILS